MSSLLSKMSLELMTIHLTKPAIAVNQPAISAVRLRDIGFGKPLGMVLPKFGQSDPLRDCALQKREL
jgi:hypothetical protein